MIRSLKYTLVILLIASCSHFQNISSISEEVYWIDHDLGFDVDDFMAMIVAANKWGDRIIGASSNFYHPSVKAKMTKIIFNELGLKNVKSYSGQGLQEGEEEQFLTMYPKWPPQFGGPYQKQGESFNYVYGSQYIEKVEHDGNGVDALIKAVHDHPQRIVIVATGPLTNIANAFKKDPSIIHKIKKLVIMGGWSENLDGSVERPSYNTLMDLKAAEIVFASPGLNIFLINSNTIKRSPYELSSNEYYEFQNYEKKTKIGAVLTRDMENWANQTRNTKGKLALYDPITILLADSESWAKNIRRVHIELKDIPGAHMKHESVAKQINYKFGEGNIRVVTEFKDANKLRDEIVDILRASIEKSDK